MKRSLDVYGKKYKAGRNPTPKCHLFLAPSYKNSNKQGEQFFFAEFFCLTKLAP
jgi:hypothetical protein